MEQYDQLHLQRLSLIPFIKKSLSIKKRIIEIDEFDTAIRHIFNYGHTFGHAIEAITDYDVSHGQAVTYGMDIANFISWKTGMITEECYWQMHQVLKKNIPLFTLNGDNLDGYLQALSKDKKNVGKQLGCILTDGPGKMKKVFLDFDDRFKKLLLEHAALLSKQS
jgi:3-dehydroquinate synthase